MKKLFYVFFLLAVNKSLCQSNNHLELNIEIPYAPLNLELFREDSLTALLDTADNRTIYSFQRLDPARYSIKLKDSVLKEFTLDRYAAIDITITNIGPCLYDHPANYKPECPYKHNNKIIPIMYGLPLPRDIKKVGKGKVILNGCTVSRDCNPHFYCKVHTLSF